MPFTGTAIEVYQKFPESCLVLLTNGVAIVCLQQELLGNGKAVQDLCLWRRGAPSVS
jgi:hypothetical protein